MTTPMIKDLNTLHPAVAALRFDRTVPPSAVNRRSAGEVFVTDSACVGEDEYAIAMRVPPGHLVWSDQRAPWHDTLATVEAFRQAFALIRHDYLEVTRGTPSSLQRVEFTAPDLSVYRDVGSPFDGVVHVRATRSGARGENYDISGTFTVGSRVAMAVSFTSVLFPREAYAEIRAYQRSRHPAGPVPSEGPADPASVGRRDPRNVVIGRPAASRPGRYPIVADQSHPSFFDRDYDHVPGTLLIEVLRQGALLASAESSLRSGEVALTRGEVDFTTFVELDAPAVCAVSAERGPVPGVVTASVAVEQYGTRAAGGVLTLTEYA